MILAAAVSGCTTAHVSPRVSTSSPAAFSGIELVGELKTFAESMGGQPTENFLNYSTRAVSDERCYFTGKLQLPEYYNSLRLVRENEARCASRGGEFDVFFYPVQAVASGEETITVALAEAPTERMLVVGSTAFFDASGSALTPGLFMLGAVAYPGGLDLTTIGATGCRLYPAGGISLGVVYGPGLEKGGGGPGAATVHERFGGIVEGAAPAAFGAVNVEQGAIRMRRGLGRRSHLIADRPCMVGQLELGVIHAIELP